MAVPEPIGPARPWPKAALDPGGSRFLALEGLRGVSAVAIAIVHMQGPLSRVFSHAYLAVDLFFLMSGAVIAHAYEARLRSDWPLARFMSARLRRLAPLYLLGTLIGGVCAGIAHRSGLGGDGAVLPNLVLGVLFVPMLFARGDLFPLNAPGWSLWAEVCANFGYGATVRTLTLPKLALVAGLGAAAVVLVTLRSGVGADVGVSGGNWAGGLARVSFGFPAGVALYRLHASGRVRLPNVSPWLLLAVAAVSFMSPWRSPIYDLAVVFLVFPPLVLAGLGARPAVGGSAAVLATAGALSYPLYALHFPVAKLAAVYLPKAGLPSELCGLLEIAALLLVAWLFHTAVDEPLQARMRRWTLAGATKAFVGGGRRQATSQAVR